MIGEEGESGGISSRFFERVREDYLTRSDLKKIDVGGGFVHGNTEDFRNDPSGKIILAHTSDALIDRQKEIGSGAPFGMIDLLIPSYQSYPRQYAFRFLDSYFPSAPRHQLRILLNNPLDTFNPDSIILKRGTVYPDIYLLLTGNVEQIDSESGIHNLLSAGALLGEMSGMSGTPATETFRAGSFVQALRLPARLYLEFIKRNRLYDDIVRLQENRRFLQKTRLFGDAISYPIQNRIAQEMNRCRFPEGYLFSAKSRPEIFLLERGEVKLYRGGEALETLGPGDFFMEEALLHETPDIFSYRALSAAEAYRIPGSLLLDIPVVRWKLFETMKKRLGLLADKGGELSGFGAELRVSAV
jgi:hemerythrin